MLKKKSLLKNLTYLILALAVVLIIFTIFNYGFILTKISPSLFQNNDKLVSNEDLVGNWRTVTFNDISFKQKPGWTYAYNPKFPDSASIKTDVTRYDKYNKDNQALTIGLTKIDYDGSSLENAVLKLSTIGQTFNVSEKQNIIINHTPALRFNNSGCCGSIMNRVFFIANGYIYEIDAGVGGLLTKEDLLKFDPVFSTFLSTIKF